MPLIWNTLSGNFSKSIRCLSSIPLLNKDEFFPLNQAEPIKGQNLALIAPGTGLGKAMLIYQTVDTCRYLQRGVMLILHQSALILRITLTNNWKPQPKILSIVPTNITFQRKDLSPFKNDITRFLWARHFHLYNSYLHVRLKRAELLATPPFLN